MTIDDCGSVRGGTWELPANLGLVWTANERVGVQTLSDGQSALGPADAGIERSGPHGAQYS